MSKNLGIKSAKPYDYPSGKLNHKRNPKISPQESRFKRMKRDAIESKRNLTSTAQDLLNNDLYLIHLSIDR